jgi:hypothetical protein
MLGRLRLVRYRPSDPWLRVVLILLLFVAVALAWHLVGMADHSDGMMMGACLALLVAVGLSLLPALGVPGPTGRSPPEGGTVLLM